MKWEKWTLEDSAEVMDLSITQSLIVWPREQCSTVRWKWSRGNNALVILDFPNLGVLATRAPERGTVTQCTEQLKLQRRPLWEELLSVWLRKTKGRRTLESQGDRRMKRKCEGRNRDWESPSCKTRSHAVRVQAWWQGSDTKGLSFVIEWDLRSCVSVHATCFHKLVMGEFLFSVCMSWMSCGRVFWLEVRPASS